MDDYSRTPIDQNSPPNMLNSPIELKEKAMNNGKIHEIQLSRTPIIQKSPTTPIVLKDNTVKPNLEQDILKSKPFISLSRTLETQRAASLAPYSPVAEAFIFNFSLTRDRDLTHLKPTKSFIRVIKTI